MGPAMFGSPPPVLAAQFDLHAPPLPGYPGSAWSHTEPFPEQIELMAANLPAGHLLGWSLGGIYALHLYQKYPEQFSGLTLVCFNPRFVSCDSWPWAVDGAEFERFADDLSRGWQATIRRFLALQLLGQTEARLLSRTLAEALAADGVPDESVLRFGLDLLKHSDCRELLFSMPRPVQMIFADEDPLVPAACARQISQIAPSIQVECVAGAAHLPFLTHAEQFGELLTSGVNPRR